MKRKVRRIYWWTVENEKTNNTEVMKDQTDCIFNNFERFVNNTILLIKTAH